MYEALRRMRVSLPNGQTKDVGPGEEVKGFDAWPVRNQQAALNSHFVRVRPADMVGQHLAQRPSVPDTRKAVEAALRAVAERQARESAEKARDQAVANAIVAQAEETVTIEEPTVEEPTGNLACEQCDFTAASSQGLKLHLTRKHKS